MRIIDIQVPYITDVYCEIGGITRARDGRFFDADTNPWGIELWAGKVHLIVDRSQRRIPRAVKALAFIILLTFLCVGTADNQMTQAISMPR